MAKFDNIMEEICGLIKQSEEKSSGPADIGGSVVNGLTGTVGANAKAKEVKSDASLRHPSKEGNVLERPEKEKEYPDRIRKPNSGSSELPLSTVGDTEMGMEDKPEKRAALRVMKLINDSAALLDEYVEKQASSRENIDQLELQKVASFEAGRDAASKYRKLMKLAAEEGSISNSTEHRGAEADTAVGQLIPKSDPHEVSDGKKPESEPSQGVFQEAEDEEQGNAHIDDTLEAQACLAIAKAHLYDQFEKAAAANDMAALTVAKAKIMDFINEFGKVM